MADSPQSTRLVIRGLKIIASPGAPAVHFDGYDEVVIDNCDFFYTGDRPFVVPPVPKPKPPMRLEWMGRMGLLDPAHPQKGMPG